MASTLCLVIPTHADVGRYIPIQRAHDTKPAGQPSHTTVPPPPPPSTTKHVEVGGESNGELTPFTEQDVIRAAAAAGLPPGRVFPSGHAATADAAAAALGVDVHSIAKSLGFKIGGECLLVVCHCPANSPQCCHTYNCCVLLQDCRYWWLPLVTLVSIPASWVRYGVCLAAR